MLTSSDTASHLNDQQEPVMLPKHPQVLEYFVSAWVLSLTLSLPSFLGRPLPRTLRLSSLSSLSSDSSLSSLSSFFPPRFLPFFPYSSSSSSSSEWCRGALWADLRWRGGRWSSNRAYHRMRGRGRKRDHYPSSFNTVNDYFSKSLVFGLRSMADSIVNGRFKRLSRRKRLDRLNSDSGRFKHCQIWTDNFDIGKFQRWHIPKWWIPTLTDFYIGSF